MKGSDRVRVSPEQTDVENLRDHLVVPSDMRTCRIQCLHVHMYSSEHEHGSADIGRSEVSRDHRVADVGPQDVLTNALHRRCAN